MQKKNKFIKIFTILLILVFLITSFWTAIVMFWPLWKSLNKSSWNTPKIDIHSIWTWIIETENNKNLSTSWSSINQK